MLIHLIRVDTRLVERSAIGRKFDFFYAEENLCQTYLTINYTVWRNASLADIFIFKVNDHGLTTNEITQWQSNDDFRFVAGRVTGILGLFEMSTVEENLRTRFYSKTFKIRLF